MPRLPKFSFLADFLTPLRQAFSSPRQAGQAARDIIAKKPRRQRAFFSAVEGGFVADVEALLPHVDARQFDGYGATALMIAAQKNPRASAGFSQLGGGQDKPRALLRLLLPHSDARAISASGWTALMFAAHAGDEESARLLLPHSDANALNSRGDSALAIALGRGDEAVARLLAPATSLGAFAHGSRAAKNGSGQTRQAQAEGQSDAQSAPQGAPQGDQQRRGGTSIFDTKSPLAWAVHLPGDETLLSIVSRVQGDPPDENGQTALMIAAGLGSAEKIRALLSVSDPLAIDADGRTALMHFAAMPPWPNPSAADCARLLAPGNAFSKRDFKGLSAFDHAVASKNFPHADVLCKGQPLEALAAAIGLSAQLAAQFGIDPRIVLPRARALAESMQLRAEMGLAASPASDSPPAALSAPNSAPAALAPRHASRRL